MKHKFMAMAIEMAKVALSNDEVPIGSVIVDKDLKVIGRGYNSREANNDITGHAEINALKDASNNLGTWKLDDCIMFVTVEPCIMCYGAIIQSRIKTVYIGSIQDQIKKSSYRKYINQPEIIINEELINDESKALMQDFFKNKIRGEKC